MQNKSSVVKEARRYAQEQVAELTRYFGKQIPDRDHRVFSRKEMAEIKKLETRLEFLRTSGAVRGTRWREDRDKVMQAAGEARLTALDDIMTEGNDPIAELKKYRAYLSKLTKSALARFKELGGVQRGEE